MCLQQNCNINFTKPQCDDGHRVQVLLQRQPVELLSSMGRAHQIFSNVFVTVQCVCVCVCVRARARMGMHF